MTGVPDIDLYQAYSFGYEAGFDGATIKHSDCLWGSIYRLGWCDGTLDRACAEDEVQRTARDEDDDDRAEQQRDRWHRASFRPPVV